jgi:hypothetical protein
MNDAILDVVIWVWLVLSFTGTGFTLWVRADTKTELRAVVRERINSVAKLETGNHLRQESVRVAMQLCLDAVGIVALFAPSNPNRDGTSWLSVGLLVLFNVLTTLNSYYAWSGRRESLAILRAQQKRKGEA